MPAVGVKQQRSGQKKKKTTTAAERSEGAADFTLSLSATGIANRRVVGSQEFSRSCVQAVERSRRLAGCSREPGGGGGLGAKQCMGWLLCVERGCCLLACFAC